MSKFLFILLFIFELFLADSQLIRAFKVQSISYLTENELKLIDKFSDNSEEQQPTLVLNNAYNSVTESFTKKNNAVKGSVAGLIPLLITCLPEVSYYCLFEAPDKIILSKILFPFHSFI